MALVSYILQKPFGTMAEGEVISLEQDEAQALLDAGVLAEATHEDVAPEEEAAEEVIQEPQNAALTRAMNRVSRNLEDTIAKSISKTLVSARSSNPPSINVPAEPKRDVFRGIGEMMLHMHKARKFNDNRSKNMLAAYAQERRIKAPLGMNETTNSAGGYDVKPEWYSSVFDKIRDYPKLLEMTTTIPAGSDTFNIPAINETSLQDGSRHGGVLGYYVAEGSPATSSFPALTQVTAQLQTLVILSYVTMQLLQDANIEGIEKLVNEQAMKELLWQQDVAVISGAGTTMPVGILNQPSLITVTKSSSDSAAMFGFDDLSKMYRALWAGSRANAVWLMNPEAYHALISMTFPNAAGTYSAFGALSFNAHEEFPMRIFGKPVIECLMCPQLGSVGDIILCDLKSLYTYHRPTIQVDFSDQIQFTTLQDAYRFVYRYDIRSPWTAPVSSVDGHYSYSPFIALQSRGT